MGNKALVKKNPLTGFFCFALAFLFFTIPASASGSVRINKVSAKYKDSNLDCMIEYPQISGVNDTAVQHKLNVGFIEMAKNLRTEAEYGAKSGAVNAKMGYKVTRNRGGIMSLVVTENISASGGQKPSAAGLTIDTVTGKRYFLSDLFIDNADYVAVLSDRVAAVRAKGMSDNGASGSASKISANAAYYLTEDSIVIIEKQGNDYDINCTVKEFAIPLKEVKEIIRPQIIEKL